MRDSGGLPAEGIDLGAGGARHLGATERDVTGNVEMRCGLRESRRTEKRARKNCQPHTMFQGCVLFSEIFPRLGMAVFFLKAKKMSGENCTAIGTEVSMQALAF